MPSETFADFLLYFLARDGVALMIATPAVMALVFWRWRAPTEEPTK